MDFIITDYEGVLGTHPRAVSFWARTDDGTPTSVITWGDHLSYPHSGKRFDCGFNYQKAGGATIDIADAAITFEAHDNITDGHWHHYVYQFSIPILKKVEVYQDGNLLTHTAHEFYKNTYINTIKNSNVTFGALLASDGNYFFNGDLDDVAIYDRILSNEEIQSLYKSPNPHPNRFILIFNWILLPLLFAILIFLLSRWYYKKRMENIIRKEMEKNYLRNNTFEQQNKVLKAQMDPHFIFNSLNTIQQFIVTNDNEKAQLYLYKFSRLMRLDDRKQRQR